MFRLLYTVGGRRCKADGHVTVWAPTTNPLCCFCTLRLIYRIQYNLDSYIMEHYISITDFLRLSFLVSPLPRVKSHLRCCRHLGVTCNNGQLESRSHSTTITGTWTCDRSPSLVVEFTGVKSKLDTSIIIRIWSSYFLKVGITRENNHSVNNLHFNQHPL